MLGQARLARTRHAGEVLPPATPLTLADCRGSPPSAVREFASPPSREEFAQCVEAAEPCVIRRLANSWPASTLWAGASGLQRLRELAGEARVSALLSSTEVFYGDLHRKTPMQVTLAEVLAHVASGEGARHVYLAQESLWSRESDGACALAPLLADLPSEPPLLPAAKLSSVALWLSPGGATRSSVHYDPYHNLLCVLSGCKRVSVWAPSETGRLCPMPLGGECSNHSRVDCAQPKGGAHPGFAEARCWCATLRPGDALFLPEGFWHQVDSVAGTVAVNYWWTTALTEALGGHSDAYVARSAMESLVRTEKARMMAHHAATVAAAALHSEEAAMETLGRAALMPVADAAPLVERVFAALSAGDLRLLLLHLATAEGETLRRLLPARLSPLSAELFTARMEEADADATGDQSAGFYAAFYAALGDEEQQRHFFEALLDMKEQLAARALRVVAQEVLGIDV